MRLKAVEKLVADVEKRRALACGTPALDEATRLVGEANRLLVGARPKSHDSQALGRVDGPTFQRIVVLTDQAQRALKADEDTRASLQPFDGVVKKYALAVLAKEKPTAPLREAQALLAAGVRFQSAMLASGRIDPAKGRYLTLMAHRVDQAMAWHAKVAEKDPQKRVEPEWLHRVTEEGRRANKALSEARTLLEGGRATQLEDDTVAHIGALLDAAEYHQAGHDFTREVGVHRQEQDERIQRKRNMGETNRQSVLFMNWATKFMHDVGLTEWPLGKRVLEYLFKTKIGPDHGRDAERHIAESRRIEDRRAGAAPSFEDAKAMKPHVDKARDSADAYDNLRSGILEWVVANTITPLTRLSYEPVMRWWKGKFGKRPDQMGGVAGTVATLAIAVWYEFLNIFPWKIGKLDLRGYRVRIMGDDMSFNDPKTKQAFVSEGIWGAAAETGGNVIGGGWLRRVTGWHPAVCAAVLAAPVGALSSMISWSGVNPNAQANSSPWKYFAWGIGNGEWRFLAPELAITAWDWLQGRAASGHPQAA
ncbi:MAG: hypothetical protein ACKVPX_10585 [Myxococcaceae bacterium]